MIGIFMRELNLVAEYGNNLTGVHAIKLQYNGNY